jgi:Fe2+ or Zn2+ uptake regulation protein
VTKPHSCHSHDHDPKPAFENAVSRLKTAGYKLTQPRQTLLKAAVEFAAPFSAEELFKKTLKNNQKRGGGKIAKGSRGSKCDLVTVYRSLATFAELGVLVQVDFGDKTVRYEWADPDNAHHHHHIVCTGCQKVEAVDFCEVAGHEDSLSKLGYSSLSHRLEFFGLCPDCGPKSDLAFTFSAS